MMFNIDKGLQPYFFIGEVVDNNDPTNGNRVKVRCLGLHPDDPNQETNDKMIDDRVDTDDLHWAILINGSYGRIEFIPDEGDWVFGFFADGRDAQHPYVLGSIMGQGIDARNLIPECPPGQAPTGGGAPSAGGSGPTGNDFTGSLPPASGTTSEREMQAMDYLVNELGYTPEHAAGIVGNLVNESTMDPNRVNPNDAGPGLDSYGLAQWNRDRLEALQEYARQNGTSAGDFNTQLEFIQQELNTTEGRANRLLGGATTPSEAALAFTNFERFQGYELGADGREVQERMRDAERIYNSWASR
jgi:hypothetical protein